VPVLQHETGRRHRDRGDPLRRAAEARRHENLRRRDGQNSRRRAQAFDKAFDRTKHLDDVLEKKFEEARKKAKKDDSKPRSPFDLD
jgi:hypothetical protein